MFLGGKCVHFAGYSIFYYPLASLPLMPMFSIRQNICRLDSIDQIPFSPSKMGGNCAEQAVRLVQRARHCEQCIKHNRERGDDDIVARVAAMQ